MDKVVRHIKSTRATTWDAFKKGIKLHGYKYYEAPEQLKYRYPAPGSCAHDVDDHPNLYKNDWKTPFRTSEYNVRPIEQVYDDDDSRLVTNYASSHPSFNASHPRFGKYDKNILDEFQPTVKTELLFPENEVGSDAMRDILWEGWDECEEHMNMIRRDYAPGQMDFEDSYNEENMIWQNRGFSGMENAPRMREMFVELEYWIEDVIGAERIQRGAVDVYKGTPKKWQILDDAVYDRDQITKIQASVDAPLPEQLESWKENQSYTIQAPYNNENVAAWRDKPRFSDSADFDPKLLGYDREEQRRLFIERYEKPKELTE